MCRLLESLLSADPALASRLNGLVSQLSSCGPSLHLQTWLHRMYELSASTDQTLLSEVPVLQNEVNIC
jgi:hypothetical protein